MIDELERLRSFRAGEPGPDDETVAAARARLMQRIEAPARSPRLRAPRVRRRVAAVLVAVCAGAIAWTVVGSGSSSVSPALAAALERLAEVAAAQSPVRAPGPGQFLYVDSLQADQAIDGGTGCTVLQPGHRQIWIAADGTGRLLETEGRGTYLSAADRALCLRTHNPIGAPSGDDIWFAAGCLDLGLPARITGNFRDPQTLLRELRRLDGGPSTAAEDFVHIGDALRESDASPALRAALYRAAATIPRVQLLGTRTDHLGRAGLAIAYTSQGTMDELIFDRHTSAFLGENQITSNGRLTGWAAYRTSRIVDRIPSRAPGPLSPPCQHSSGYMHTAPGGVTIMTGAPSSG